MADDASRSLYERIGGDGAVEGLLGDFYGRVLGDPELRPFFDGVAMGKLRRMQHEFFAAALGGPIRYTGRPLAQVHAGRGIRPRHLQRFMDHLMETLRGESIDEDDAYEIVSRINTYADQITDTTSVDG